MASTSPPRERNDEPSRFVTRAARFGDDQRAGGDVPGLEARLPESVQPSGGDVAQVDRRRAKPPHRARHADEVPEQTDDLVDAAVDVVRETR